jgi:hypothetical protein
LLEHGATIDFGGEIARRRVGVIERNGGMALEINFCDEQYRVESGASFTIGRRAISPSMTISSSIDGSHAASAGRDLVLPSAPG